ncbi:MAG TPA: hypothetical protein VLV49_07880 [Terriglobales bacterium]|nr:hypothetical protein [Terriglobales bacterium]
MNFVRHLSDEELTDLALEEDERHLRQAWKGLPASLRLAAERPESFWQRQQAAIRSRMDKAERGMELGLARAAAAVLAMAAIFLLQSGNVPPAAAPARESDQQLLLSVERTVHSDVPEALEPAALLADDALGGAHATPVSQHVSEGEQQ